MLSCRLKPGDKFRLEFSRVVVDRTSSVKAQLGRLVRGDVLLEIIEDGVAVDWLDWNDAASAVMPLMAADTIMRMCLGYLNRFVGGPAPAPTWPHIDESRTIAVVPGRAGSVGSHHWHDLLIFTFVVNLLLVLAISASSLRTRGMTQAINSQPAPDPSVLNLPIDPGNGVYDIEKVNVRKLKKAQLKDRCKQLRLSLSGNKQVLIERLVEFSNSPDKWHDHLAFGARNMHKNPRSGPRKSALKPSEIRHDAMFGPRQAANPPANRSQDMRTPEEKAYLLIWARNCTARYDAELTSSVTLFPPPSHPPAHLDPPTVDSDVSMDPPPMLHPPSSPPTSSTSAAEASAEISFSCMSNAIETTFPSAPAVSTCPPDIDPPQTVMLADGTHLSFCSVDIPSLPTVSFADNIPRLGRIWDDAHHDWDPKSCILHINGHAIALKHWPDVYRNDLYGRWEKIKKSWSEWQFLAIRWHQSSPESFWQEFSHEGMRLRYTAILQRLRAQRKAKDAADAECAKVESGIGFVSEYSYRKGNQGSVRLSNNTAIAKRYRMKCVDKGVVHE
ncbi:hypothetical protein NP233_g9506 [Leucocoprinus birnbaumii]|uniref:SAP domain-containing protein n=1 Tax=Leucocoprinus birnbaumii TaxID=56174 RepID=A0AAD5YST1_9AGAR|nr:hypothetical protein NP233_g9506 [Leucocoprinus birnbaumii]